MINKQLLNPGSIVVVGGSNDVGKPGGKVLKNLIEGCYKGKLYVLNLKEDIVQGIKSYKKVGKFKLIAEENRKYCELCCYFHCHCFYIFF